MLCVENQEGIVNGQKLRQVVLTKQYMYACLRSIVSHMNDIKMDDKRSDLGITNKINDIIKKKMLK